MIENVGRKVVLILSVTVLALLATVFMRPNLGLDLKGGTRVVMRVPFEKALQQGQISAAELNDKQALINQMIGIYRERVDPDGIKEAYLRPEGEDRIVIELPAVEASRAQRGEGKLASDIGAEDRVLELAELPPEELRKFPSGGGSIEIGKETILYEQRSDRQLTGLTRGALEKATAHSAGDAVVLKETDDLLQLLTSTGDLHFYIEASENDFQRSGTDRVTEEKKVRDWMTKNPDARSLEEYNLLARDLGGPPTSPRIFWYTMAEEGELQVPFTQRRVYAVVEQDDPNWRFSGNDLASSGVGPSQDSMGRPAVGFAVTGARSDDFLEFTKKHQDHAMAIVINSAIATMPTIRGPLPGGGVIEGGGILGFKPEEVERLVKILRSGSLRIRPEIESQERVGATLGSDSIRRGIYSGLVSLVLVLGFMVAYYRSLGWLASLSLVVNMILILGTMSFWQATLTLPGIAGMILTIGMAVDSNILIYERIREEQLRGRKPLQAAKDGFAHARSTIVDSNLTTLVSGIVLYALGTGPIRGFATTLCVGIITTMFAALVVTHVLVHFLVARGVDEWKMARWISDPHYKFMSKAKLAFGCSLAVIVSGLVVFASLPARDKLGIEFTGGVTMTVRTEAPQSVLTIRERVRGIPGTIGETSEVRALLASGSEGDGYRAFQITFKTDTDDSAGGAISDTLKDTVEGDVKQALAEFLERGPYELSLTAGTQQSTVAGKLYFDLPHPDEDVKSAVAELGIEELDLKRIVGPVAGYEFQGKIAADRSSSALESALQSKFEGRKDSQQQPFTFSQPIDNLSTVGAAVVEELRDKALIALAVSMFGIVMYIRVRFTEYSYGIAAVVALLHDVLVALAAMAFAVFLDKKLGISLVDGEINLSTVAAFLTIIGYSVNDTVVTFDRIRENLPRMKASLWEIMDVSINQTLSRTILTAGTVFITVTILFFFNVGSRNVLEGFSFAMIVGTVAGTYSSIYIACPILHYLEKKRLDKESANLPVAETAALRPHPKAQSPS